MRLDHAATLVLLHKLKGKFSGSVPIHFMHLERLKSNMESHLKIAASLKECGGFRDGNFPEYELTREDIDQIKEYLFS